MVFIHLLYALSNEKLILCKYSAFHLTKHLLLCKKFLKECQYELIIIMNAHFCGIKLYFHSIFSINYCNMNKFYKPHQPLFHLLLLLIRYSLHAKLIFVLKFIIECYYVQYCIGTKIGKKHFISFIGKIGI